MLNNPTGQTGKSIGTAILADIFAAYPNRTCCSFCSMDSKSNPEAFRKPLLTRAARGGFFLAP